MDQLLRPILLIPLNGQLSNASQNLSDARLITQKHPWHIVILELILVLKQVRHICEDCGD
jgi:hypothetical protein